MHLEGYSIKIELPTPLNVIAPTWKVTIGGEAPTPPKNYNPLDAPQKLRTLVLQLRDIEGQNWRDYNYKDIQRAKDELKREGKPLQQLGIKHYLFQYKQLQLRKEDVQEKLHKLLEDYQKHFAYLAVTRITPYKLDSGKMAQAMHDPISLGLPAEAVYFQNGEINPKQVAKQEELRQKREWATEVGKILQDIKVTCGVEELQEAVEDLF